MSGLMNPNPPSLFQRAGDTVKDVAVGVATNNPLTMISDAIAGYRQLFNTRWNPETRRFDMPEVDRKAQPLTSEWVADKAGADDNSLAFMAGGMLSPSALKSGAARTAKIVAGENAANPPKRVLEALDTDEAMLGVPGRVNRDAWVGPDGRVRWEIPDRDANMMMPVRNVKTMVGLDQILDHPELFKQYPELRKYKVAQLKKGSSQYEAGAFGAHDAKGKIIYINPDIPIKEQLSTIMHETQHAVQKAEGFAGGASGKAAGHLAVNMMVNYRDANPQEKRRLRAMLMGEFNFDPEKDSIQKLSDRLYRKKAGEVESRGVQARLDQWKQTTPGETLDEDFLSTIGRDKHTPILWQDVWQQFFGTRELPPYVDLQTGKTIPIRDF